MAAAETSLPALKRSQAAPPQRQSWRTFDARAVRRVECAPVTRRKPTALDSLRRRIASVEASDIDQLYGLEPVFEPDSARAGLEPVQFVPVRCPYCGERLETRVDLTGGEREYIEDCEVCCRPIEFSVELEEDGALRAVRVQRID
ncbi:MAG: CPXCG motif-containing cysteine-rich protein [Steroidobacteraceae bacterium]|nr:CPXCG motif-containing cysteine-rich protein [Steroidobacteraceae bacterium]